MDLQPRNSLKKALNKVQIAWNGIYGEKNQCLANFERWIVYRRQTLLALQKFQDEFDKIHLYSSTARAVSNGASVLGILATAVGFGLSFFKDWNSIGNDLMKYGSTVGSVGGAATVTASLVECGFNASVLREVKATLEKDRRQTEELLDWFNRTKEMDVLLREVFGCGVANINDVAAVIREISVICYKGGEALDKVRSYLSALITENFTMNNSLPSLDDKKLEKIICNANFKVKLLLKEFCDDPELRTATRRICDSFKNNPILFDVFKISVRITGMTVVQQMAFLSSTDDWSLMFCTDSTVKGLFRAINVALSIVAFLSAVDDVKNGKSKYSEMVQKNRYYLLFELEELVEALSALKNTA